MQILRYVFECKSTFNNHLQPVLTIVLILSLQNISQEEHITHTYCWFGSTLLNIWKRYTVHFISQCVSWESNPWNWYCYHHALPALQGHFWKKHISVIRKQRRHLGKQFGIFLTQCESPQKDVTAQSDEASERKTQRHHLNIMPLSQEHNVPIRPHIPLLPIH